MKCYRPRLLGLRCTKSGSCERVSIKTTYETSQTDTHGTGSARSLRLKNSSQKKPSQYCDTALMRHTFRNVCTEANFGARIRYSDNVSGPLPTSTVVLPNCVALLADPRRRPSRSSTPDQTEPIHLVNQCRRMWIIVCHIEGCASAQYRFAQVIGKQPKAEMRCKTAQ
jgi:hypothetical protein